MSDTMLGAMLVINYIFGQKKKNTHHSTAVENGKAQF